jgi:hypothetical protein
MSTNFEYSPINSKAGEIRLIHLPPRGADDDPTTSASSADAPILDIKLQPANVHDKLEYIALSYVWGDMSDKVLIKLNGREAFIGRNLFSALQNLRATDVCVTVWADALCINQADMLEKGHQIRHMRNVYQTAQKVVAWLGPYHEDIAVIDSMVETIRDAVQRRELSENEGGAVEDAQYPPAEEALEKRNLLDVEDEVINSRYTRLTQSISIHPKRQPTEPGRLNVAITRILSSEWWRRAWIIQEFVVARRVEFRMGSSAWDLGLLAFVGLMLPIVGA